MLYLYLDILNASFISFGPLRAGSIPALIIAIGIALRLIRG